MKETKVYTGRRNGKHAELMQRLDKALKEQHFAFVFTKQELKVHDRELVKEVCEKIKEKVFGLWYFVLNEQKEHFDGNRYVLSQKDFNDILDQIQKEFEK